MDARAFLDELARLDGSETSLAHIEVLPQREPLLEPFPDLPELLRGRLELPGDRRPVPAPTVARSIWSMAGRNVIIATGTASGKTLVYNLGVRPTAIADEKRTALYLFPTKALARDQLRQVRELRLPRSAPPCTTATRRRPSAR